MAGGRGVLELCLAGLNPSRTVKRSGAQRVVIGRHLFRILDVPAGVRNCKQPHVQGFQIHPSILRLFVLFLSKCSLLSTYQLDTASSGRALRKT